jgi:hypothetical protein
VVLVATRLCDYPNGIISGHWDVYSFTVGGHSQFESSILSMYDGPIWPRGHTRYQHLIVVLRDERGIVPLIPVGCPAQISDSLPSSFNSISACHLPHPAAVDIHF